MRVHKGVFTAVSILILCIMAGGVEQNPPAMSTSEFVTQIDRVLSDTETLTEHPENGPALAQSLPDSWTVSDGKQRFEIPTDWLRAELEKPSNLKPESLTQIRQQLATMRDAAQEYSATNADGVAERTAMNNILARSEFRNVHGPTWWDRLKQRINEWLLRQISGIFGSSAFPTVTRVFAWTVVGIAVLFVAWAVFRALRRNAGIESLVLDAPTVSAKAWGSWLSEARAAAARGEWREAIHLAYWAGISLLEAHGAWRPDRARTPREYLRLLPSQSEHRPALSALTRRFEVVWYGYTAADEQAYQQTLAELEKLGCR